MKILLTINDISITGGAERVCVNLANALSELGHQVSILSFYQANTILPYRLNESVNLHIWHNIAEAEYAKKQCRNILSKMYHKNLYKFVLSLRVWKAYGQQDVILVSDWTFFPFFKHRRCLYIKIQHSVQQRYAKRNNLFDMIVFLTYTQAKAWQNYHKNIKVIPNLLPFISQQNTDSNQHRILSVGRLSAEKGFLRLIDIWGKVQERIKAGLESKKESNLESWQLVIVGSGILQEQIESKIKEKNLQDTITLKPFTKDIEKEYLNASIYAMSSHFEGFGMVLVEASSYALPCVAFDIAAGPSDIIESGVSGYLIEDNDLQDYADKLFMLMSDKEKRESMGLQAKQRVKERFSKEAIMPLWEEVFRDESV